MSILTSLYTGLSGLTAHGEAIGVVGDNIANTSTIGFRGARASFHDVLGDTAPNGQRMGAGVRMAGTQTNLRQGSLLQTGGGLDLAIRGDGFFMVNGSHNGVNGSFYTRDGRFGLDKDGYVVSSTGMRLQGYSIDTAGTVSAGVGDVRLGGQVAPVATTEVDMSVNLDPTSPAMPAWDPTDPGATSNYSTSVTVYDSLGGAHRVDVYFCSNGAGSWDWHAMADGGELTGGTAGTPVEIASGTVSFTTDGKLDTETVGASSVDFLDATPGQAITFDFGDSITTDGGTGMEGATQYAGESSVNAIAQDGIGAGELVDIVVDEQGTVSGVFSNGQSRDLAKLAMASFQSEGGLQRAGDQLFMETNQSGQPLVGFVGSGGRGGLSAGMLESSNVDIGNELVTMIAFQRAFQANARTVSTADEMMAEISNLKR